MIDPALLDRLREADPETYGRYLSEKIGESDGGFKVIKIDMLSDVPDCVKEAWLQHVLQEAIQTKGWSYHMWYIHQGKYVEALISMHNNTIDFKCDTESEALLRAYLEAIKG
jgi:hypothetical protein